MDKLRGLKMKFKEKIKEFKDSLLKDQEEGVLGLTDYYREMERVKKILEEEKQDKQN